MLSGMSDQPYSSEGSVNDAYYNEIDPYAAAWLRNLVDAGHVAPGRVDERSITDLKPADVAGPGQRHFFAGIGVWSYALRLAGVADGAAVWTGSCPCQPFSVAGKRAGVDDERHLWPAWYALIRECRPAIVLGEQVAGAAGRAWLDAVFADMEAIGYAVAGADLPACGIGAPHLRSRLFWVAHLHGGRLTGLGEAHNKDGRHASGYDADRRSERIGVGDADCGAVGQLAGIVRSHEGQHEEWGPQGDYRVERAGADGSTWDNPRWVYCNDPARPRWRPVEPGTFPLAARAPNRVGRLRAYGNAIVAPLAATFIQAALESRGA